MVWMLITLPLWRPLHAADTAAVKAQLEICGQMEKNRGRALKAAGGETPVPCRQQIELSLKTCLKNPDATKDDAEALSQIEVATTDFQLTLRKQLAAFNAGKQRYVNAAAECDDERKLVGQACGDARDDLKTALRDNGQANADAQSALVAGGADQRVANRARVSATGDVGRQLQSQITAGDRARAVTDDALGDASKCFQYQADAYAAAIAQVEGQISQSAAQADQNTVESGLISNASVTTATTGSAAAPLAPATSWTSYASLSGKPVDTAVSALGVVGGKIGTPVNIAVAGGTGDYWSAAQGTAGAVTPFFESRALGLVGGLPGALAVQVMSPTEAGTSCDVDTRDPAAAARAGCATNIGAGRALDILRSP